MFHTDCFQPVRKGVKVARILPYLTVQYMNLVSMLFQIAEGDICRGLRIPIYMIFPRLFTCPTLATAHFKIGQWLNL